jgi:hypothetical protein
MMLVLFPGYSDTKTQNKQKARAMNVTSLEQMEQIVSKNKALTWDGWTVVHLRQNDSAYSSKQGAYLDGQWYMQDRFDATETGWNLPNKFVR